MMQIFPLMPHLRHPPLSLRDISPTRGEIVGSLPHPPTKPADSASASTDSMLDQAMRAPQVTNLPPCGGDVATATEGGEERSDDHLTYIQSDGSFLGKSPLIRPVGPPSPRGEREIGAAR